MSTFNQTSRILQFKKAQYITKKARIGLSGPSGSGKTLTALKIAAGLAGKGKFALIDTENNSSVLYADRIDFDVLNIEPPFEIDKYINAIKAAGQGNYAVLILDSISHAWAGEGGLLDTQGKLADGGMNSFTAWRKLTPKHNAFIEAMLRSNLHIIATMRSKMEYIVEQNDKGKAVPKKVGLAPIQREGMDYEFDLVFDLDLGHNALASKDRSSLFDGRVLSKPDERIGHEIASWLNRNNTGEPPINKLVPTRREKPAAKPSPVVGPQSFSVPRSAVSRPPSGTHPHPTPPAEVPTSSVGTQPRPLFDNNGRKLGEQETEAMLFAIKHAASTDRLASIEQSMGKGLNAGRITTAQALEVRKAIEERTTVLTQSRVA